MPPHRTRPITDPVAICVDGHNVMAQRGEPLAVALAAARRLLLGRSLKYHRARGAFCYTGQCDGCLMRVDGVGNTMTCETPCRENLNVETQNVLGSPEIDLLSVTDWVFPTGLDHHHLMTSPQALNHWMQFVARKIAGAGKLPYATSSPPSVETLAKDVLVVGTGAAGSLLAAECAAAHLDVLALDEGWELTTHAIQARNLGADTREKHSVVGVYERYVLVMRKTGLVVVRPRFLVVATGTRETLDPCPGSDLPGVMNVTGAQVLLRHGVVPGEKIVIAGEHQRAQELKQQLEETKVAHVQLFVRQCLKKILGRVRVRGVEIQLEGESVARRVSCDSVIFEGNTSAVYELAVQAGASVVWRNHCFEIDASRENGRTSSPWTFAVGSCTGATSHEEIKKQVHGAAQAIIAELSK